MDICVILGSKSDLPIADKCRGILEKFEVSFEIRVASAHRAPKYLEGIVDKAESEGCKVFIGMAGVAAALPGVIASMTSRPVIGVPVGGKVPLDSLLSIVQMPPRNARSNCRRRSRGKRGSPRNPDSGLLRLKAGRGLRQFPN